MILSGSLCWALLSCTPEPFVQEDLEGSVVATRRTAWTEPTRLNLLLLVDNSVDLEDVTDEHTEILVHQTDRFLRALLGDLCIDDERVTDEAPDEHGYCESASAWAHDQRMDLRVGVVSTSLDCEASDQALLVPRVRSGLLSDHPAGFLIWDTEASREDLPAFRAALESHIRAAAAPGCRYPQPFEVLYRFAREGTEALAQQRADFLRHEVPVLALGLLQQDDCSLDPRASSFEVLDPELPADDQSCRRLVATYATDPRIPSERYTTLTDYFTEWRHTDCPGGVCRTYFDTHWVLPGPLAESAHALASSATPFRLSELGHSNLSSLTRVPDDDIPLLEDLSGQLRSPDPSDWCLGTQLDLDDSGSVACRVVEAQWSYYDPPPDCTAPGRRPLPKELRPTVDKRLEELGVCDVPLKAGCSHFGACELEQLSGPSREDCLSERPTLTGYCYTETSDQCLPWKPTALRFASPPARPLFGGYPLLIWCQGDEE
jgi:hypothetical protein